MPRKKIAQELQEKIWKLRNEEGLTIRETEEKVDASRYAVEKYGREEMQDEIFGDVENEQETTSNTEDATPEDVEPEHEEPDSDPDMKENTGVQVEQVKPETAKTSKQETTDKDKAGKMDEYRKIDPNDPEQVQCVLKTTSISKVEEAQHFLKACATGQNQFNKEFEEIRIKDGDLR